MSAKDFVTALQHIGIPTNDIQKTVSFYESLGFSLRYQTVNENTGEEVAFLGLQNITVETWQSGCAVGKTGAIDHIALEVTDIDRAYERLRAEGFHILDPMIQYLPYWNHGTRFFTIEGPNAEKIEFSQILQEDFNV